ncbi:MAG: hypothetical protein RCG15_00245 [Candidatus Rickettsia vulgarisii]
MLLSDNALKLYKDNLVNLKELAETLSLRSLSDEKAELLLSDTALKVYQNKITNLQDLSKDIEDLNFQKAKNIINIKYNHHKYIHTNGNDDNYDSDDNAETTNYDNIGSRTLPTAPPFSIADINPSFFISDFDSVNLPGDGETKIAGDTYHLTGIIYLLTGDTNCL